MPTCAVSGRILDAAGAAIASLEVSARVVSPQIVGTSLVVPALVMAETNASGNFVLTVEQAVSVIFTVCYPPVGTEPKRSLNYSGTIPATSTADFTSVVVNEV